MSSVYIVDDDAAVRQSLQLLARSVGLAAEAYESGTAFLAAYHPGMAGCLIADIRMPGLSGLELQQALKERGCGLPIVFITGHADVAMAVRAMRAGALDFIEKPFRDQELLDRINQALQLDAAGRAARAEVEAIRAQLAALTPREREVMERIVQGQANKVIAIDLGLSERTVEIHRAKVMAKTGANSLAELVSLVAKAR
ncbi:MAG: response regulator transcription factor [Gammaproteobacteria bacterium]